MGGVLIPYLGSKLEQLLVFNLPLGLRGIEGVTKVWTLNSYDQINRQN